MDNRNNTDPGDSSRLYPDPQHKKCSQMLEKKVLEILHESRKVEL